MNFKGFSFFAIGLIIVLVVGYAMFLLGISWPIENYSISNAALYGDSFGILNALFSGLAFAGIIITILLQREELKLQRNELARASVAQESNARLAALSLLLNDYKTRISVNSDTINEMHGYQTTEQNAQINEEINELCAKRDLVIGELEKITSISKT
jgi:hypothetical protein